MMLPDVSYSRPGSSVARSKLLPITSVPPPPPPPPLVAGALLAARPDAAPTKAGPTPNTPTAASATANVRRVLLPALIHVPLVGARCDSPRERLRGRLSDGRDRRNRIAAAPPDQPSGDDPSPVATVVTLVVEPGVDPGTFRFSGGCSAD